MAVKLPFVVQPRLKPVAELIGSPESGQFEVERRGYLTSGEKSFMAQARSADDTSSKIVGLARKVAAKNRLDLTKAYELVSLAIAGNTKADPKVTKVEQDFPEELNEVYNLLTSSQAKEGLLQATCLMMYRVDPDWTIKDTMDLHPDLLQGLVDLYNDEEKQSIEALDPTLQKETSLEEIEKKPNQELPT